MRFSGPENVYSFGIRSGMKEEFEWAKEVGMNLYKFDVLEPLKKYYRNWQDAQFMSQLTLTY